MENSFDQGNINQSNLCSKVETQENSSADHLSGSLLEWPRPE